MFQLSPNPLLGRVALAALVAAIFFATAVPLILYAGPLDRAGFDQLNFHEPAIRIFAHDWAHRAQGMNFKTYLSATTPGYHVALAFIARFIADSSQALQMGASLFTAALVALLAYMNSERAPLRLAFACTLCVLASRYVFFPGVWLLPDNAGWLCVVAMLGLALRRKTDLVTLVAGSAILVFTVLTRQTHAWVFAPFYLAFLWPASGSVFALGSTSARRPEPPAGAQRFLWGIAAAVPAFMILSAFYRLWNGLTPPLFQYQYANAGQGFAALNFAAPAFLLAIVGLYAPFFAASWLPGLLRVARSHRMVVVAFLAVATLLAMVPATTYAEDHAVGRWEGLWGIAGKLPTLGGHTSLLILGLALVGSCALLGYFARLPARESALVLITLAGFAATQAVANQLWQRYHEPLALILLSMLTCRSYAGDPGEGVHRLSPSASRSLEVRGARLALYGPLLLAMVLGAITTAKLARSKPDHKLSPDELMTQLFPSAPKSLTPRMEP